MKAALLTALRKIETKNITDPELVGDNDVIVNVRAVGICGSDVHYYTHGGIGRQVVKFPFIVGHEGSGTIWKTGKIVVDLKPGDNVVMEPAISCGECDQCLAGRENTCRKIKFISCPGESTGCLCEKIVMPAKNCFKFSDKLSFELAAFAEPLSIGVYSVKNAGKIKNAKIAVLGCGPIGLSVMIAAKKGGVGKIFATDKLDYRLGAAEKLGADHTANPDKTDICSEILDAEPGQLDVVFECSGNQDALDQSLILLKPGGRLVIVGIPESGRISFDPDYFRRKELTVFYMRRQNKCIPDAISIISSSHDMIEPLITHKFRLDQCMEAFETVANYRDGVIKAVVLP